MNRLPPFCLAAFLAASPGSSAAGGGPRISAATRVRGQRAAQGTTVGRAPRRPRGAANERMAEHRDPATLRPRIRSLRGVPGPAATGIAGREPGCRQRPVGHPVGWTAGRTVPSRREIADNLRPDALTGRSHPRGDPMRRTSATAFALSLLVSFPPAFAQGPAPAATPGAAPTMPAQDAANHPPPAPPALAAGDPRVCLEFPSNLEIIRCAEKYLPHRRRG